MDTIRYHIERCKNRRKNRNFSRKNPEVKLPPDYLIYESFRLHYKKYYNDGMDTAVWLYGLLQNHIELKGVRILDWGCGPGRIIRHLPSVTGPGCEYYGTDTNRRSVNWCSENLPAIRFNHNTMEAKLPYPVCYFDIIYGISVFTHLSEPMHFKWFDELYRILRPGGIMLFTTQGDNFKTILTHKEITAYDNSELVVRGHTTEGHRTYSTFQPAGFMEKLFHNTTILEHIMPEHEEGRVLPQDIWIVRKHEE
jgi:SAM-dependent methyltransferase